MLRDDRLWWVLAALAAAVGAALGRRRQAAPTRPREEPTSAPDEPPPAREPWSCECGQEFLVAGRDRHRVYWIAAAEADPVLDHRCPNCDRALPAGDV